MLHQRLTCAHQGELCQKGYARMNEFEAHEGSYDHQHRKRLKDMRQLTKDPNAAAKARAAEQKANEEAGLKSINISLSSSSTSTAAAGKKKPVFKSTLQPHNAAALGQSGDATKPATTTTLLLAPDENNDPSGAVRNGWFEDRYQPQFVTGCDDAGCEVCQGGRIDLGPCEREDVAMKDS
ncbi:hypothetical protein LTR37_001283 [Vermiconidia calcicola]|uniref:Uncharacterized protein n=1 Tax=Vermiconidia calcicola TaxID=1690605 RepID=A0ACC3NVY9_9PEZI|nr:hypothetical protein LTR37_001283 [Vermiconidia calcicola]